MNTQLARTLLAAERAPKRRLESARTATGFVAFMAVAAALIGWHGATSSTPQVGYDAEAHIVYAQVLGNQRRLPTEAETYEFATPPAYAVLAVGLQAVADETGDRAADVFSSAGTLALRLAWLAAAGIAISLLLRFPRGHPIWAAGLVLAGVTALAALIRVDATAAAVRWTTGQLLSIAWMAGLIAVAYLLARELWPSRPYFAVLAGGVTALIPIVLRLGVMFHPEMQFAFFSALAVLLVVRAHGREWPLRYALGAGTALGLAALTRPTAAAAIGGLGLAVMIVGRRQVIPFLAVGAGVILLIAGPWWGWQTHRYANPLESNLDRYILEGGQPRSFYISAPIGDLVANPHRPNFAGELWPQFHADLWSDWFGIQHDFWQEPPEGPTRFFVSSQSVLGFPATLLALGGLFGIGSVALVRAARGRLANTRDFAFAAFILLVIPTWIAFVVQLVRFPQEGGDPIKSSYMLYLTPVFAVSMLAAAVWLWRRALGWRIALVALGGLYAASYAGFLVTAW